MHCTSQYESANADVDHTLSLDRFNKRPGWLAIVIDEHHHSPARPLFAEVLRPPLGNGGI
jgi:superfamily II DNA or RNA helicase